MLIIFKQLVQKSNLFSPIKHQLIVCQAMRSLQIYQRPLKLDQTYVVYVVVTVISGTQILLLFCIK